jgi:hypothetical protein
LQKKKEEKDDDERSKEKRFANFCVNHGWLMGRMEQIM